MLTWEVHPHHFTSIFIRIKVICIITMREERRVPQQPDNRLLETMGEQALERRRLPVFIVVGNLDPTARDYLGKCQLAFVFWQADLV